MDIDDGFLFPPSFPDCGNKSFYWVFVNRKEFVDFTIHEMESPTGFFKRWKDYLIRKIKGNG